MQIRQFCYYDRSFVFRKTEFKLIVSKAFSIRLLMFKISAIYHVAFTVSLICKVEGLNI